MLDLTWEGGDIEVFNIQEALIYMLSLHSSPFHHFNLSINLYTTHDPTFNAQKTLLIYTIFRRNGDLSLCIYSIAKVCLL